MRVHILAVIAVAVSFSTEGPHRNSRHHVGDQFLGNYGTSSQIAKKLSEKKSFSYFSTHFKRIQMEREFASSYEEVPTDLKTISKEENNLQRSTEASSRLWGRLNSNASSNCNSSLGYLMLPPTFHYEKSIPNFPFNMPKISVPTSKPKNGPTKNSTAQREASYIAGVAGIGALLLMA